MPWVAVGQRRNAGNVAGLAGQPRLAIAFRSGNGCCSLIALRLRVTSPELKQVNHGTQPCRILFVLMDLKEP